jgi:cell volume regulation protein A
VFVLTGGLLLFGITAWLGGSGFLAIYMCGVIIRARCQRSIERVLNFHQAMAWLSQIALFLMLS